MDSSSMQEFGIHRYGSSESAFADFDQLAVEEPLEIIICYRRRGLLVRKPISITMRTPGLDPELAVGFLYTEGIIHHISSVESIENNPERGSSIVVTTRGELDLSRLERHFYASSSCGICGKTSLQALGINRQIFLDRSRPKHPADFLVTIPDLVRKDQAIFSHTGGLHAAALFDAQRKLLRICEDVGRHNAVDKLIGAELRTGREHFGDLLLFVSGRAGFELVQKSLMSAIPFMIAVGAPSSLAVELARAYGSTLIGFLREKRFNVYSCPARVDFDESRSMADFGHERGV